MMIVSMQCKKCLKYYNGAAEKQCPYCGETGNIDDKKYDFEVMEEDTRKKTEPLMSGGSRKDSKAETKEELWQEPKPDLTQAPVKMEPPVSKSVPQAPVKPDFAAEKITNHTGGSLQGQISRSGKTIGKFFSSSKESVEPVMGWLVCVKGTYFGEAFKLINGRNRIGRAPDMDVNLENDNSISSTCMASIMYDSKGNRFSIIPGESSKLCYVNNEALYERKGLTGFEEIEFGDAEYNKFVFVPLCGEHFQWSDYKE